MVSQNWMQVFSDSFGSLWPGVAQLVLVLIIAVLIFIIGWIFGSLVERLIEKAFRIAKVDTALRHAGLEAPLQRGGIHLNSGAFVGGLIKWFIIAVFLLAALQFLGLEPVTLFLQAVLVNYLPRV